MPQDNDIWAAVDARRASDLAQSDAEEAARMQRLAVGSGLEQSGNSIALEKQGTGGDGSGGSTNIVFIRDVYIIINGQRYLTDIATSGRLDAV